MSACDRHRDGARLHVVTGKGGTGKTTLAAALALALASGGRRVLLMEVEGRQGIARLFECPPLPHEERWVATVPGRGELYALAVDPEAALLEYLATFYGMRRAGKLLTRFGVVDFATSVAPGISDVLLTGKATEAVRRRRDAARRTGDGDERVYDAVVLDAPPTGRVAGFLNVNSEVAGLARVGPIHDHAERVMATIRSLETVVHFVTVLEDMPVQETLDGIVAIEELGLATGGIFHNMVLPRLLDEERLDAAARGEVDPTALARGLEAAGLRHTERLAGELGAELVDHARRVRIENQARERLLATGRRAYEVPLLVDGIDRAGLDKLADQLRDQGAV